MRTLLDRTRTRLSFGGRRLARRLRDLTRAGRFASERSEADLPVVIREHRLPIYRNLAGVDRELFDNKKVNLRLAMRRLDGVLLRPGKTLSLWRLVGPPTAARGFRDGLVLDRGEPSRGVGGGLCQLANALFWLALHSDLTVTERHHHSVDLFPDDGRTVPFGTGATIVYNFKDLRLENADVPGAPTYQFRLRVEDDAFVARLLADREPARRYRVSETGHGFEERADGLYRRNAIVREAIDASGGRVAVETLFRNFSKCRYTVRDVPPKE